jgi:hypothetical protein
MSSPSYVIIQYYCTYSSSDWKIIGCFNDLEAAKQCACRHLLTILFTPHVLKHYTNRKSHSTPHLALPDISIEHWNETQKITSHNLGWEINTNIHVHNIHKTLCQNPTQMCEWNENPSLLYEFFVEQKCQIP